jgi:hypothetical protein
MAQRIAELCAHRTPSNDLTDILNEEIGLKQTIQYYWRVASTLGLVWTPAKRRPPEVPLAELPICIHCGKVRMPVLWNLSNTHGQRLLLCEDRCCPTCGGKLELHTSLDKATGKPAFSYWAHALPLLPRNCSNPKCGKQFTPTNTKKAHKETCSHHCMQVVAVRNWEKMHPEQALKFQKQSSANRQANVIRGRILRDLRAAKSKNERNIGAFLLLYPGEGNIEIQRMAGTSVSGETMRRIRDKVGIFGPSGAGLSKRRQHTSAS